MWGHWKIVSETPIDLQQALLTCWTPAEAPAASRTFMAPRRGPWVATQAFFLLCALGRVLSQVPTDEDVGLPTDVEIDEVLVHGHDIAELVDEHELDMWGHDDGSSLLERFNEFERKGFVTTVSVEVRLVGFQGFGNERIILPAHSVLKHLDAFTELGPERLHVGHTEHTTSNPRNLSGHDLNVFQQLLYTASDYGLKNVDKNGNTLLKNINKVVDDSVVKAQRSYLPISSIDRLVADDYETNPSESSYVIYILNPKLPEPTTDPTDGHLITGMWKIKS